MSSSGRGEDREMGWMGNEKQVYEECVRIGSTTHTGGTRGQEGGGEGEARGGQTEWGR